MKNESYLSILLQQFQNKMPIYSEDIIIEAKKKASNNRAFFMEFLSQTGFREKNFIRWLDLRQTDFANGMDAADDMGRGGADIRSAKYVLMSSTINGLQFFYDFLQDEYFELCKEQNNPFWLFPLWEEFHKTNSLSFINKLSPFLQGFFLYTIWDEQLLEAEKQHHSLEQLLDIIYNRLPMMTFMTFTGKVTEPLIRNSFDANHQERMKNSKQWLSRLHRWMTQTVGKTPLEDEAIKTYLKHLKGRVNRESWLAALYFANELDQLGHSIARDNARLIRIKVTSAYPEIWLSNNSKDSNFLSGIKSLALISEIADALLKLYEDKAITVYWNYEKIIAPQKLWHLRNIHDYSLYINKRTLVFVHSLLLTKMIEKSACTLQIVNKLHDYVTQVFRQVTDHHIFAGEELVVQNLLETIGLIYQRNGILKDLSPELIDLIAFPGYAVYLLKGLDKRNNINADILPSVENKLESDLPLMSKKERTELSFELYHVGAWLQCCEIIKHSNLIDSNIDYRYENLILLYGSAVFQSIPYFSDKQIKKEYLKDSLTILSDYQRKNPYTQKIKITILRGYLIGELYDLDQLNFIVLVHEYSVLVPQSAEMIEDQATLAYVKVLLLVRLIQDCSDKLQYETFVNQYEGLIKDITPLQGIDGTKALLQAWITHQENGDNLEEYVKEVQNYMDEVRESVPYLPRPVREFAEKILTEG